MSSEWFEGKLADACRAIDYGLTASASKTNIGPRFLRITDITSSSINWNTVPFVEADQATSNKYQLYHGDIVLARTGASTGTSAYINEPPLALFASYLVRLQIKPEFDSRLIAYYLKSNAFLSFIHGVLGDKSAQPNASASTMTQAPLRVPKSIKTQRAIAHILGTLDDKIELNRRTNETLEGMARALFHSWFVAFDPVRAKAEGRDPALPAALAALFPDSFEESALGQIPAGWRVVPFSDTVEIISGGTPKTSVSDYWEGDILWYSVVDAPLGSDIFVLDTARKITKAGLDNSSAQILAPGTTILSARGTVGKLALTSNTVSY